MPNGCGKCWEEFKGWLKAFTPIETLLTILEAILLVLLIAFIIFFILHFLSCHGEQDSVVPPVTTARPRSRNTTLMIHLCSTKQKPKTTTENVTSVTTRPTCTYTPKTDDSENESEDVSADRSEDVSADTSEDESGSSAERTTTYDDKTAMAIDVRTTASIDDTTVIQVDTAPDDSHKILLEHTDGELANEDERQVVLALVRIKPSGLTFGCILTVVSERWTVTAASCLDSIEEVDSLDNFVIIDNYDEPNKGRSHAVTDVRVHPLFAGGNKSYDLALLRSGDDLGREPVRMPSLLDYFKLTVGQAVKLFGFGPFRNRSCVILAVARELPEQPCSAPKFLNLPSYALGRGLDASGQRGEQWNRAAAVQNRTIDSQNKRVHSAFVHVLPMKHCTPSELVERHLVPLAPVEHGRCGAGPVCGGVLYARGTPCNYCAGAPLMRARVLLGVMADHEQCGAACEPALHANVAAARDWIAQVIAN